MKRASWPAARAFHSIPNEGPGSPAAALHEMQLAGVIFNLCHDKERQDWRYGYTFAPNSNAALCQALIGRAKARPEPFVALLRVAVFAVMLRREMGLDAEIEPHQSAEAA